MKDSIVRSMQSDTYSASNDTIMCNDADFLPWILGK